MIISEDNIRILNSASSEYTFHRHLKVKSRTAFLSDFSVELISTSGSEFNTYFITISKGPMYKI
jgi:hypothetical protein